MESEAKTTKKKPIRLPQSFKTLKSRFRIVNSKPKPHIPDSTYSLTINQLSPKSDELNLVGTGMHNKINFVSDASIVKTVKTQGSQANYFYNSLLHNASCKNNTSINDALFQEPFKTDESDIKTDLNNKQLCFERSISSTEPNRKINSRKENLFISCNTLNNSTRSKLVSLLPNWSKSNLKRIDDSNSYNPFGGHTNSLVYSNSKKYASLKRMLIPKPKIGKPELNVNNNCLLSLANHDTKDLFTICNTQADSKSNLDSPKTESFEQISIVRGNLIDDHQVFDSVDKSNKVTAVDKHKVHKSQSLIKLKVKNKAEVSTNKSNLSNYKSYLLPSDENSTIVKSNKTRTRNSNSGQSMWNASNLPLQESLQKILHRTRMLLEASLISSNVNSYFK